MTRLRALARVGRHLACVALACSIVPLGHAHAAAPASESRALPASTPGAGKLCTYAELGDRQTTSKGTFRCQVVGRRGRIFIVAWVKVN